MHVKLIKKPTTKKDISAIFKPIEKLIDDSKVINFNDNRKLRKGMSDWLDHVIITYRYLVFIEVKLEDTGDKIKKGSGQEKLMKLLSHHMAINKTVHYFLVKNLKDAQKIFDGIIQQNL